MKIGPVSTDGADCRHGVNLFDPRGCAKCTAEYRASKPIEKANGHVPHPDVIAAKFEPTETD